MKIHSKLHFNLPNEIIMADFMDTITKSIFKFYYGNQKNPFLFLSYISSIYDDDEILKGS